MNYKNKIFNKSALELEKIINEEVIDTIITSPPYWNQKDYNTSNQIGYGQSREAFFEDLKKIFYSCYRVTKKTGAFWLIVDDFWRKKFLQLLPWEFANCAIEVGWHLRDTIIWDKGHNVPFQSKGQMRHVSEYIFYFTKTPRNDFKFYPDRIRTTEGLSKWWVKFPERFNPNGKLPTNIWSIPVRTQGSWNKKSKISHHCPFPTELVSKIIDLSTDKGDLILDPFAGTGIVLAAANAKGRKFVGFEVNSDYINLFNSEVKNEVKSEVLDLDKRENLFEESEENFRETILKLRALKFTRQAIEPLSSFSKEFLSRQKITVVIKAEFLETKIENKLIDLTVIVLSKNPDEIEEKLNSIIEISNKTPLTNYGIKSSFHSLSYSDFFTSNKTTDKEIQFFLYEEKWPKNFTQNDIIQSLLKNDRIDELLEKGKIPLLADFSLDVSWYAI